ncbi:MAG: Mur ligase family protein [Desulfofustis sp.]
MTIPQAITGDTVAVVGFGRAGQSMVHYLCEIGIRVVVSDIRNYSSLGTAERELLDRCVAEFEGGGHSSSFLSRADLILVSPGVDQNHSVLQKVRQSGTPLIGELALAADKFKAPVIAVTGTNGKTTVTELIGSMLKAAGRRVFVGGNIGTPIGEYLLSEERFDAVVLEVSSFQLELCGDFFPDVGILLNITPDHLDRHKTVENYAAAKMKIFQGGSERTFSVINGDDPLCRAQ